MATSFSGSNGFLHLGKMQHRPTASVAGNIEEPMDEGQQALIDCVNEQIRSGTNTVELPVVFVEAARRVAARDALDLCRINDVGYILVAS